MDIYHVDQTGLGYLIASFAFGGLLGSVAIGHGRPSGQAGAHDDRVRDGLVRDAAGVCAYARAPRAAAPALVLAGLAQSLSLVPMSAMLLHGAGAFRGRVMGMRMLAIYGLPIGLTAAGALIDRIGFAPTATLYCGVGLALTLLIALRWRAVLWPLEAQANAR